MRNLSAGLLERDDVTGHASSSPPPATARPSCAAYLLCERAASSNHELCKWWSTGQLQPCVGPEDPSQQPYWFSLRRTNSTNCIHLFCTKRKPKIPCNGLASSKARIAWPCGYTVEARKLEHHWLHALTVKYRESQHESY